MKKKRVLSALLALCMIVGMLPLSALAVDVENFSDVSEDSWYYEYVDYVTENEFFIGVSDTEFDPEGSMTRAMFVTVLARVDGADTDYDTSDFTDVEVGTWYSGAVQWASENGIVLGRGDGIFDPDGEITREEMCVIMDRYVDYYEAETGATHDEPDDVADEFLDADSINYPDEVEACRLYGLVEGFEDGYFYPQGTSTRAQVAAVITRLNFLKTTGSTSGSSSSGDSSRTSNVTYYTVTVNYDPNGGTLTIDGTEYAEGFTESTYSVASGEALSGFTVISEEPVRDDYTFAGWSMYYGEDSMGTVSANVSPAPVITADLEIKLVAVWISNYDYLALGTYNAVTDVKTDIVTVLNNAASTALDYAEGDSSLYGYVDFSIDEDAGEDDTRDVGVYLVGNLTSETVENLVTIAVTKALKYIPEVTSLTKSDVKSVAKDVLEELGLEDYISGSTLTEIVQNIYSEVVEEGRSIWSNYKNYNDDTKYPFESVAVSVYYDDEDHPLFSLEVSSDGTSISLDNISKTAAAKKLAAAIAKAYYDDLKDQTEKYSNSVETGAAVTLSFDGVVTEAQSFPSTYNYNFIVMLESDNLSYKWDEDEGQFSVKLKVTEDIQEAYADAAEDLLDYALGTATVTSIVEEAIEDKVESNSVVSTLLEQGVITSDEIAAAAEKWVSTNLSTYAYAVINGETPEYDNSALYELVSTEVVDKVVDVYQDDIDKIIEEQFSSVENLSAATKFNVIWSILSDENFTETDMYLSLVDTLGTDVADALGTEALNYIMLTAVQNYFSTNYPDYDTEMTDTLEEYAEAYTESSYDLVDDLVSEGMDDYDEMATSLAKLMTLDEDGIGDVSLNGLNELLNQDLVLDILGTKTQGIATLKNLLSRVTSSTYASNASITIGDYGTLDVSVLADIDEVSNYSDLASWVQSVIKNCDDIADLKLNDFAGDGIDITVTYGSRNLTFNFIIEFE